MTAVLSAPEVVEEQMPEYPIPAAWILEGTLDSRGSVLVESADGKLGSGQWCCSPGKFRWEYTLDEFFWVIEGEVEISIEGGKTLTLREGSTAHLPKGTVCVWNVIRPIRKVFFYRNG
jgi:uncharacterized protein